MNCLVGCDCQEIIDLCGQRARVCETSRVGGELVTHCEDLCLPMERVYCTDLCC
jgi:hypothetical protein